MVLHGVQLDPNAIAEFCRRHDVARLQVFGSILGDEFNDDSDVDLLIEFRKGKRIGLLGLSALELELSRLIGRKVDLRTPNDISRHFRARVMAEAQVQYAS